MYLCILKSFFVLTLQVLSNSDDEIFKQILFTFILGFGPGFGLKLVSYPDPYQNVTDPQQHCVQLLVYNRMKQSYFGLKIRLLFTNFFKSEMFISVPDRIRPKKSFGSFRNRIRNTD
jgi:hypothetical protein